MDITYGSVTSIEHAQQQLTAFDSVADVDVVTLVEKRRNELTVITTTTTKIETIKTELITRIENANQRETQLREEKSADMDSLATEYQVSGL